MNLGVWDFSLLVSPILTLLSHPFMPSADESERDHTADKSIPCPHHPQLNQTQSFINWD